MGVMRKMIAPIGEQIGADRVPIVRELFRNAEAGDPAVHPLTRMRGRPDGAPFRDPGFLLLSSNPESAQQSTSNRR